MYRLVFIALLMAGLLWAATGLIVAGSRVVQYELAWDRAHTTAITDGTQGWRTETDLGYFVELERAYIVNYSAQLIACAPQESSAYDVLFTAFSTTLARAGHGEPDNSSQTSHVRLEDFAQLNSSVWGQASFSEPACQVHILLASSGTSGALNNLTEGPTMPTLLLRGTYWHAADPSPVPFEISSDLAWGAVLDLESPVNSWHWPWQSEAKIVIQRQAGSLFDGVDFVHLSEIDAGRMVLRSLFANTDIVSH